MKITNKNIESIYELLSNTLDGVDIDYQNFYLSKISSVKESLLFNIFYCKVTLEGTENKRILISGKYLKYIMGNYIYTEDKFMSVCFNIGDKIVFSKDYLHLEIVDANKYCRKVINIKK